MDVGVLYINAMSSSGEKRILELEVYLTDLNDDRYAQVKLKTPLHWTRAYNLPCNYISAGGTPQLIIGNGFLNKFPHVTVANINGLTLNKSSISQKYFIQGSLKNHQVEESNTVIKSNKVVLAPMDREFLQYNFVEDMSISKSCLKCNILQCDSCKVNPFVVSDVQREQDSEMYKLLHYNKDKEYITTQLPFNNL